MAAGLGCRAQGQDRSPSPRCVRRRVELGESYPPSQKAGLKVVAAQNPLDSLDNDVAATKRAIRNAEVLVVLVGHSWAGAVITEAENDDKVKSLVYLAAYAPDKGESVKSATSKYPDPESLKTFVKEPDGYLTISE
ncbi:MULTISPECIES: hypothetical protein [unclassified Bradyrhizobium]|uniref:hypothetical protein n=1 Tax=unclassified Bradyrhizobium TaxID=2631580 RepID=UPI0028EC8B2A|nr:MULTISPECIES: hypothetical protein [unclassified Bradyrhizobium]